MSLKIYTRTCAVCGAVMHNVGPVKQYCIPCASKRALERAKERQARLREQVAKERAEQAKAEAVFAPRKNHQKPTEDNTISAVLARADAAHRTYGQQVEFERRQKELKDRGEI